MPETRLTRHVAGAALHVAAILGDASTPIAVAHESYWRRATGAVFSVADLILAEDALVAAGFVLRSGDMLIRMPPLASLVDADESEAVELLAVALLGSRAPIGASEQQEIDLTLQGLIDDPERREELLLSLGQRWDDAHRREIGAIGEEIVVAHTRSELSALGRVDLARAVRRVSLVSDQLGYDVVAPRVGALPRLLEVKATTAISERMVFLSRGEADAGSRFGDWALVLCVVHDVISGDGEIVGWCQRGAIEHLLPADALGSRWQSVSIDVDRLELQPGLPRPSG